MTPKEFQKSNLTVELKAGKKRLEDALRGLGDEQCERAGATRSGSVMDLLSEIVTNEFLALMEVSDRLLGLPMDHLANADGRIPIASGAKKAAAIKSVENLLTEFGVLRSAIIRRTEGREPQGAKHAYVVNVCVTRFNEQIDEIERWRSSEIVGFSAARLRAEAREAELNQAIVDLSREDFLAGDFDLKSLFSLLFDRFYSEDFVLWLGAGEANGRTAAFQCMANGWNRSIRCSRWGWLPSRLFAQLRARRTPRGISSLTGRPFSEEGIRQAKPFVGAPFGHGGVAWLSPNASRIYHRRNPESLDDARVDARRGGTADLRGIDFAV
jgi:hypothetical protein